ncbi:hypothetical protein [Thalassotalea agariperforans]
MNRTIYFLLLIFISFNSNANELLGKWSMKKGENYFVILFQDNSMTQATSPDLKDNAQTVSVKYVKLKNSYGIELLDEKGKEVAAMMATFINKNTIKFGAPGSLFFELQREE